MTRSLTTNQHTRRLAILERLRSGKIETASQLRSYLAQFKSIYTTQDTVLRDLHAMMDISGSVTSARGYPYHITRGSLLWEATS